MGIAVRRSGLTFSAVGGVGLDGFHISGVASGRPRCGGGFRVDDGWMYSVHGIVSRYRIQSSLFGTLTLLWSGLLRSHAGALPGPGRLGFTLGMGAASDRMAAFRQRRTALIGQLPVGARDPMDPILNLAVPLLFRG